jgi:RNA polymerase sigma factor (sigma-70 family)
MVGARLSTELSDSELLDRFTTRHDEEAFELLVQRHGPLVLRVCRRVLQDVHDAEDAFQATFLVLARKAASIRNRASVGGWLYEIAYHLAVQARAGAARRRHHERRAGSMIKGESHTRAVGRDVEAVLDEELGRLPEKYRTPLVLCYLEGKTNEQAARELGWPSGSISSRLARARELLRDRLVGRGVALSAGGLTCLLGASAASATLPASLVRTTAQAALLFAVGKSSATAAASAGAVALAEGVVNAMITSKLKLLTALILTVTLLGAGAGVLIHQKGLAQEPGGKGNPPAQAKEKDQGRVDFYGDPLPPLALSRLGSLRLRHDGVFLVSYLPDGKLLTAGSDGMVRIWNEKGQEVRSFGKPPEPGKKSGVVGNFGVGGGGGVMINSAWGGGAYSSAAISPDGKTLAFLGANATLQLWDVAQGKTTQEIKTKQPSFFAGFLGFSPDSKNLFLQGAGEWVRVYETATGKEVRQIGEKQGGVMDPKQPRVVPVGFGGGIALSPDGKNLVLLSRKFMNNQVSSSLTVYNTATGKEVRQLKGPDNGFLNTMAISPDGKSLVWSNFDGTIHFWNLETGVETSQLGKPGGRQNFFSSLRFSPDGKTLAAQSGRTIKLWDVKSGKELRQLGEEPPQNGGFVAVNVIGFGGTQKTMAFSKDGKKLVAALDGSTLQQWDVASGKEINPSRGHQGAVLSALLSEDGKTVTTLGADSTVRQWEAATGKELRKIQLPASSSATLGANGRVAVAVEGNGAIRVWDVPAKKEVRKIDLKQNNPFGFGGASLALSPDGKLLAMRNFNSTVRVWDVTTGNELRQTGEEPDNGGLPVRAIPIGGFGRNAQDLVFSPDGQTLAFLGFDSVKNMNGPGGGFGGGFGPGQQIIHLWDVKAGKLIRKCEPTKDSIVALTFSPDGKTLASRGQSNITLWETATGKERFQIKGQGPAQFGFSNSVISFSPDGKTLAASDQTRALRLWDVATGKELGQLKGHQGSVETVAFASDSNKLVSGSSDTTALTWDVAGLRKEKPMQPAKLTDKELSQLWDDLNSNEPTKAFQAIHTLRTAPEQAVALLQKNLKPAVGVQQERIAKLIGELGSDTFKVRQQAMTELDKLGAVAGPALTEALKKSPPLETRQRIEKLLKKLSVPEVTGELLRSWRAMEALEMVGTQKARQAVATLAKGAPGAPLTVEAQKTLDRMTK